MSERSGQPFIPLDGRERRAVLTVLALLVTGVGVLNLTQARADLALVWLAFVTYALVLALPFVLHRPAWGWLHPLVFTVVWVHGVRYLLPRLGVFTHGLPSHRVLSGASPDELNAVVVRATLLAAAGLLAFYAAFLGPRTLPVPRLHFRPPRGVRLKVAVVAAVALFALFRLAQEAGGLGSLMLFRGLSGDARAAFVGEIGGRHWHYLVGTLEPACLAWLAVRPTDWRRPLFLGFFTLALGIAFVATGSRSGVVIPVLMAGMIVMLHRQRISLRVVAAVAVFALLVVGVGGEFRTRSRGADRLEDVRLDIGVFEGLRRGVETAVRHGTATDGTYGILARVPDEVGLLYGRSYLSMLFAPIPNVLLPFEKPEAGGRLNAIHIFNTPNTAIPPGNVGEAYWNFHVPGVLLVMFGFGLGLRWLSRLYLANGGRGWVALVYVLTLFGLQPNSPAVYGWLQTLVPAVGFLCVFCGPPRRERDRSRRSLRLVDARRRPVVASLPRHGVSTPTGRPRRAGAPGRPRSTPAMPVHSRIRSGLSSAGTPSC